MPTRDSGTAKLGMIVAAKVLRNRKITRITRAMVSISSNSTSSTEARIVVVRSVRICIFTAAGIDAWSWGSRVLMRSTTAMMFAPGWRWMLRMTAGVRFIHAASLAFSVPSTTVATSCRVMGLPFL